MVKTEAMMNYACQRADAIFQLTGDLSEKLRREGFSDLFAQVEMPLGGSPGNH